MKFCDRLPAPGSLGLPRARRREPPRGVSPAAYWRPVIPLPPGLARHVTFGTLDQMPSAYFDANLYDHIAKRYIPDAEVEPVRGPLARRHIIAYVSIADVEELLGDWDTDRAAALARLRGARDLVGFEGMLKQPRDVLAEAIEAYAAGRATPSPLAPRDQRETVAAALHRAAEGDSTLDRELFEIIGSVRAMKEGFHASMAQARTKTLAELKLDGRGREERRALTFQAF